MSTAIQLPKEEVTRLQNLKQKNAELTATLADLTLQQIRLEIYRDSLKESVRELLQEEQSITQELVAKYGPISIDLEQGTATKVE